MKRKFCMTPSSSSHKANKPQLRVSPADSASHMERLTIADQNSPSGSPATTPMDETPDFFVGSPPVEHAVFHGLSKLAGSRDDVEPISRPRTSTITASEEIDPRKLPTVFKWEANAKQVFISGSYDNWKSKIPMVKSHGDFYTIIDLPEGTHQYKYNVDGQWVCDPNEPAIDNGLGSKNNQLYVKATDFEVFEALAMDSASTGHSKSGVSGSPPGEYSQFIPPRNAGGGFHHSNPPTLPPHLLQVILNKEIPLHCEPTLLPEPNHVMLNHLYALSIKDGVMVLSATHRYRKKYVTTLLYKPI